MYLKLLDRNNNTSILLAGILALIIGVGVARFVFTSLLPLMLEDFLSLEQAGILASLNYCGYLGGSIFAIFIKDINAKVKYFRLGIVLCVLTTLVLALTSNELLWLSSRVIAGFAAAMSLVVGSAIVMTKLNMENKTKAMGIHFSGIGFSVLVTDLISRFVLYSNGTWQDSWLVLSIFAATVSIYPLYILSFDKRQKTNVKTHKFDKSLFSPFVIILILVYFTEGVGMVVQATFLPDIINSIKGLENYGSYAWTAVGLAGVPSCIIWMTLANKIGSINVIIITMFLQVIGILIPTFSDNIYLNLFSGLLFGGTFVALVALFMNLAGKLAKENPLAIMGAITTAYGVGQVIAPLYSVYLTNYFSSYNYALYVTALIVFGGIILLFTAKKILKINH
ncbi:MAG: YbfB/YjiJ family MFS transporter [Campylobacteraceae bacterium]|nr:YbfB/YjiJ family MFS transporter [Campylobacteraceae bacterium]